MQRLRHQMGRSTSLLVSLRSSGTQEEILKAMERVQAETEKWRLYAVDLERPVFAMCFVQLQARFEQKGIRKKRKPRSPSNNSKRNSNGDGNGDTKGKKAQRYQSVKKVQKVDVLPVRKRSIGQKTIRMLLVVPTRMLPLEVGKWLQMAEDVECVFMHTGKAGDGKNQRCGNATIAIRLETARELNCVLKDEQGST